MQIPNIDQAFDEYLQSHNADHHTMREVWHAAAKWMADDILATLADYATACEGLPAGAETMTPAQMFDRVYNNLQPYVYNLLLQGEKDES